MMGEGDLVAAQFLCGADDRSFFQSGTQTAVDLSFLRPVSIQDIRNL